MQMAVSGVVDGSYAFDNLPGDIWHRSLNAYQMDFVVQLRAPAFKCERFRVTIEYVRAT
jgi:hypothetical protein